MKTLASLIVGIAVLSGAHAQGDDLFREDGPGKSNRNLTIGNRYYEGVQIVGRLPGGKVEISAKGGRRIVDEKHLPPLWSAAIDKREAGKKAEAEARAKAEGGPEEKAQEELNIKMTRMRTDVDEMVFLAPLKIGKSDGGSIVAIVLGFRKNRSEVLMSDGKEVAWVKMSYFNEESAKLLRQIEIKAEKAGYAKTEEREARMAEIRKDIRKYAAKEWPDDHNMQLIEAERQEKAWGKICYWGHQPPFGITKEQGDAIWKKAWHQWPDDYCMQVIEVERQAEALSKLKHQ